MRTTLTLDDDVAKEIERLRAENRAGLTTSTRSCLSARAKTTDDPRRRDLLLYAVVSEYSEHAAAHEWLDARLNGPARVGLPWQSLLAFLRISTNPRPFSAPLAMRDAWRRVERWLECENVWTPAATPRHREILGALLTGPGGSPKPVSDAHLAALALGHGLASAARTATSVASATYVGRTRSPDDAVPSYRHAAEEFSPGSSARRPPTSRCGLD